MVAVKQFCHCKRFASGHVCGVTFSQHDWRQVVRTTQQWHDRGWCTYDERQLFNNDVWRIIDRYRRGTGIQAVLKLLLGW